MDKLNELEMQEIELIDIDNEEEKQKFSIENRGQLSWAMRKVKALEAEKKEFKEIADKEIQRIKEWYEEEARKIDNHLDFFESLIMIYAMKKRQEDKGFKSEATPYGKVIFRKQPAKWHYDEKTLVSWLIESDHIDLVKVVHEPKKAEIKKRFVVEGNLVIDTETGEPVQGITIQEPIEKIDIKISDE